MRLVDTGSHAAVIGAAEAQRKALCDRFTLPNPRYVGAVRAGKTPIGIAPTLAFFERDGDTLLFPAAALPVIKNVLWPEPVRLEYSRAFRFCDGVDFRLRGDLRLYQLAAVLEATAGRHAVIEAPTGSGKTVISLACIAQRRQPALVIVHSKLLLEQWTEAAWQWLGVEPARIGGGVNTWERDAPLTVAIVNSLSWRAAELSPHIGHVVVDECHRSPAPGYREVLAQLTAPYRLGLSATPWRSDGLTDVIHWQLGQTVRVERAPLVASGAILPAQIEQCYTDFATDTDASQYFSAAVDELTRDPMRNELIASDALTLARDGLTLCLTDRQEHTETLAKWINITCGTMEIAHARHGGQRAAEVRAFDEAMAAGKVHVMVATTQLVGEGFDLPRVHAIQLCAPIRWRGKLLQAIGRALRPSDGQTHGRVIDYVDRHVPVLLNQARARARAYRKLAKEEGA